MLMALGYDRDDAERALHRRTPTPILTSSEQRVLSAILVSRPRSLTASITLTGESARARRRCNRPAPP